MPDTLRSSITTVDLVFANREVNWCNEQLTLADRTFHCQACGLMLDRDLNAAINLAKLAGSSLERQNACGEESAGQRRNALVQLSPLKQEPDTGYPAG